MNGQHINVLYGNSPDTEEKDTTTNERTIALVDMSWDDTSAERWVVSYDGKYYSDYATEAEATNFIENLITTTEGTVTCPTGEHGEWKSEGGGFHVPGTEPDPNEPPPPSKWVPDNHKTVTYTVNGKGIGTDIEQHASGYAEAAAAEAAKYKIEGKFRKVDNLDYCYKKIKYSFTAIGVDKLQPQFVPEKLIEKGSGASVPLYGLPPTEWIFTAETGLKVTEDNIFVDLGIKDITIEIGGNTWEDEPAVKEGGPTGRKGKAYAGMQVKLYERKNDLNEGPHTWNVIRTTTTDAEGVYKFKNLDPFSKYYVEFMYNGQLYQATIYNNNISAKGGWSNAKENIDLRNELNASFTKIDATPENYDGKQAFPLYTRLRKSNGEFIACRDFDNEKPDQYKGVLTFSDVWAIFRQLATAKININDDNESVEESYENILKSNGDFERALKNLGVADTASIIQYIKDCFIVSKTNYYDGTRTKGDGIYPVYDLFYFQKDKNNKIIRKADIETWKIDKTYSYLYTDKSDQSRYVDFGISRRETSEVALQKDIYKATIQINGKQHVYNYSKKALDKDGIWTINIRASDELYNGEAIYERAIRPSEYLYEDENTVKNLQVYVTYRIAVTNRSQNINTKINEIVDYYDSEQYEYNPTRDKVTRENTYIGKITGEKLNNNLKVSEESSVGDKKTLTKGEYNYEPLYLTGITSESGDDIFEKGELGFVYITFRVRNDEYGRVKMDQNLNDGSIYVGKRNMAEINGYSTYYANGATVPNVVGTVGGKNAGIIDTISSPGNLDDIDLIQSGDHVGDIITDKSNLRNRLEPDTDKAPNFKLIIDRDNDRKINGYVYEDERKVNSRNAIIGNGIYDSDETKINGVKVELVELVQEVDSDGLPTGKYADEEKTWETKTYSTIGTGNYSENKDRYYSGIGKNKVILTGPGILNVNSEDSLGDGEYKFTSVPPGDFFIRFTYGDSAQTVLTKDSESKVNVGQLTDADGQVRSGLNDKSYNGQDYKSTVYQKDITQTQSKNEKIKGYTDYTNQNNPKSNNSGSNQLYYYNITESSKKQGASDAKDIYGFKGQELKGTRETVNSWSTGYNKESLLNQRAEILASFEKIATGVDNPDDQAKMIKNLIENTQMSAQTGVIDVKVEYERNNTDYKNNPNFNYKIEDVDLGLVERPRAQLKLNKEITNIKITLASGRVIFNTNQSVNNLYFAKHKGHDVIYSGVNNMMLSGVKLGTNNESTPELIQAYMDEELIAGANIEATYELTVENVGEVDYLEQQFYYTGTGGSTVSRTDAREVVDYVSNLIEFDNRNQIDKTAWNVKNAGELIQSQSTGNVEEDLVNSQYLDRVVTYNRLITTEALSGGLLPSIYNKGESSKKTTLVLTKTLANTSGDDEFIYNNLAEIVRTHNDQGRRMQFSISGNQEMADQSIRTNNAPDDARTSIKVIEPAEIDADSAQKIVILPPTGENRNYIPIIITLISALSIAALGIVIIKKILNTK